MAEQRDDRPAEAQRRKERERIDDEDMRDEENGDEEMEEDEQYTSLTPQDESQQSVLLELEGEEGEDQPLGADERLDRVSAETNAEVVLNEMSDYTEDQEILDDFAERQLMPTDEQGLMRDMREHHAETPEVTAGDVDAAWEQAEGAGDETPSTEPIPDEDRVDEIGEAIGVTYEDDEPLDFAEKVWERDEERWELDPESAEDEIDQVESFAEEDEEDEGEEGEEDDEVGLETGDVQDEDDFLDTSL